MAFSLLKDVPLNAALDFTSHTRDMVIASIAGRGISADDPRSLEGKNRNAAERVGSIWSPAALNRG
ncbi:MAG: hypothetical protein LBT81_02415 [Helicobacteraceae bacterium]|nr:hypothetical protein [Helicobacteraceae bacterium]